MSAKIYLFIATALLAAACGKEGGHSKAGKKALSEEAKPAQTEQSCRATTDAEIAGLFDRWNAALKTGKADIVVSNYAPDSILLPTVSNEVRHTAADKKDYFEHWLPNKPSGEINERFIQVGCNTALDAGVYTFTYANGQKVTARYSYTYAWNGDKWLITSHHSSAMPERTEATPAAVH